MTAYYWVVSTIGVLIYLGMLRGWEWFRALYTILWFGRPVLYRAHWDGQGYGIGVVMEGDKALISSCHIQNCDTGIHINSSNRNTVQHTQMGP